MKSIIAAFLIASFFLAGNVLFAQGGSESLISTQMVEYYSDKNIEGYLATPSERGEFPVVILIHEWWGLNDYVKGRADDLANLGFVVLAVNLYGKESTTDSGMAREMAGMVSSNMEGAFDNLNAALDYVKTDVDKADSSRIGSMGWCFGGGWSYQMAKNNLGTKASVIYYGRFNPADDLSQMRATILGNFGEDDRSIKVDDVKEFHVKLKTLNGDHEVYIYPNAGHAFDNSGNPSFNQEASDLAWERTVAFLREYL